MLKKVLGTIVSLSMFLLALSPVVIPASASEEENLEAQTQATVRNLSQGAGPYFEQVSATRGDVVQLRFWLKNSSEGTLDNVQLKYNKSSYVDIKDGTVYVEYHAVKNYVSTNFSDFQTVINSLPGDDTVQVVMQAEVDKTKQLDENRQLVQEGIYKASNLEQISDTATVNYLAPAESYQIDAAMYVRNVSKKEGKFSERTEASKGEVVEYLFWVKNVGGNPVTNLQIKPSLPFGNLLTLDTSGTLIIHTQSSSIGLSDGYWTGIVVPKLIKNDTFHIRFKATVSDDKAPRQLVAAMLVKSDNTEIQKVEAPIWVVKASETATPEQPKEEQKPAEQTLEKKLALHTKPQKISVLPRGGANGIAYSAIASGLLLLGLGVYRRKKILGLILGNR